MALDPVDALFSRIEALERLFEALRADPESPAWPEIQRKLAATRQVPHVTPALEPQNFIRGGFGEEMDTSCSKITSFFLALPGWRSESVSSDEVVYLAGFFAFIALASSPTAPLGRAEAETGARATVARMLMLRRTSDDALARNLLGFKARLNEYSALWAGILKGENGFGSFAARVFENVHAGGRTRDGYVEHLDRFPAYCEERIQAFHEATARNYSLVAPSSAASSG